MKAFFKKVWAWIVAHKVVSIVIASVLAVGIALAIILPIALHQHDYEENWSQGYISHWHNATCHENEKKDIEKHIFEKIDVKPAKCTEDGSYREKCTVCGFITATKTVDATGHTPDNGVVTKAPTCTEEGVKTYTCTVEGCGTVTKTEVISAIPHTYKEDAACATKCTACNQVTREETVAHTWNDGAVTKKPTCTETGVMTYTCTVCDQTKTTELEKSNEHSYVGVVTTPATCGKDGVMTYTCTVCSDSYTEKIDATGEHNYNSEITDSATCGKDGVMTYTCTVCSDSYTEEIKATGEHKFTVETSNAPIYKEDGAYNIKKCENCDATSEVKDENVIVATTAEAAQAALDGDINGKTLVLLGDADFGVLYVRIREDVDTPFDDGIWAGSGNYTYNREFNDVTIIGASETKKASVEAIVFEALTYTKNGNQHSNSSTSPYLNAYIEIDGLMVKHLSFTGERTAIELSGNISAEKLTIDSCDMTGNAEKVKLLNRSGKQSEVKDATGAYIMTAGLMKDITINNCVVDKVYQVIELRGTENVSITNNTFTNISDRVILLPIDGVAYTGTITITGNTAVNIGERFVRFNGQGYTEVDGENVYATIIVSNNTIVGFTGTDKTVIKISATDKPENVTCENNTLANSVDEEAKTLQVIKADDEDKANATMTEIYIFVQDASNVLPDPIANE